jgi:hypothetical protein
MIIHCVYMFRLFLKVSYHNHEASLYFCYLGMYLAFKFGPCAELLSINVSWIMNHQQEVRHLL